MTHPNGVLYSVWMAPDPALVELAGNPRLWVIDPFYGANRSGGFCDEMRWHNLPIPGMNGLPREWSLDVRQIRVVCNRDLQLPFASTVRVNGEEADRCARLRPFLPWGCSLTFATKDLVAAYHDFRPGSFAEQLADLVEKLPRDHWTENFIADLDAWRKAIDYQNCLMVMAVLEGPFQRVIV